MMPKSDLEMEIEEILAKSRQKQAGESSSAKKKKKKKKRRPISQDSQEVTTASKANEATSTKLYEQSLQPSTINTSSQGSCGSQDDRRK